MDQFEYLSVLTAVVIGLGITHLLVGVGRLLRRPDRPTLYWIHTLQVGTTFLALVNQWWVVFSWADFPNMTLLHHLFLLASPISLFLATELLFPDQDLEERRLRDHYYRVHRPYYLLLAVLGPLDVLDTLLKGGWDRLMTLGLEYLPMQSFSTLVCVVAAFVRAPRYHAFVQIGAVIAFLVSAYLWKPNLEAILLR